MDKPEGKANVYQEKSVWLAVFLGGPLIAGYIIAENFKAFNEYNKARTTWAITIPATLILFAILFLLPEDIHIPNQLIPIAYTGLASVIVQHFQGGMIKEHIASGGKVYGWGRVALIGFTGLLITAVAVIAAAVVSDISGVLE